MSVNQCILAKESICNHGHLELLKRRRFNWEFREPEIFCQRDRLPMCSQPSFRHWWFSHRILFSDTVRAYSTFLTRLRFSPDYFFPTSWVYREIEGNGCLPRSRRFPHRAGQPLPSNFTPSSHTPNSLRFSGSSSSSSSSSSCPGICFLDCRCS